MFKAYPYFIEAQGELHSYKRGFFASFFGFLFER
jgi:hypothetical protein